jgi:hypothetical protein
LIIQHIWRRFHEIWPIVWPIFPLALWPICGDHNVLINTDGLKQVRDSGR